MAIVDVTGTPLESNPKIVTFDDPVLENKPQPIQPPIVKEEIETVSDQSLGFIKSEDIKQVKELIKKRLGWEPPRVGDAWLMVELYVRPEDATYILDPATGKRSVILVSEKERVNDKYTTCVGLVVGMGPKAYRGILFEERWYEKLFRKIFGCWMRPSPKQPICSLGDWVVFPRPEGSFQNYRGKPMCIVPDDRIFYPVADPDYVTRN